MHTPLSPQQTEHLLENSYYGHLACHDGEELYLVPITFAYSKGTFFAYTQDGKKTAMMKKNPKVCVQVEKINGDGSWESVIAWGTFHELTDRKECQTACLLLADEFAKVNTPEHPIVSPLIREISQFDWEKNAPVVYSITVDRSTGRAQTYR